MINSLISDIADSIKTNKNVLIGRSFGSYFLAFLIEASMCACGKSAMIVVNRDGKTRCLSCDSEYTKTTKDLVSLNQNHGFFIVQEEPLRTIPEHMKRLNLAIELRESKEVHRLLNKYSFNDDGVRVVED